LLDELGSLRLDEIGPREIEAFKARRKKDGVGNKSINEELAILSKLLDFANEVGDLPNPPPKIRRLKVKTPKFDYLDFDEAERLHAVAQNATFPWCVMIPIAMLTGLRLGELRGLQWDDVDLVAARIHVQRAADDKGVLGSPKNDRDRVVDLPQRAVAILRKHKHLRGPFVFCREDGSMLQRWHCESKSKQQRDDSPLMKLCRKAGLRRIGWHSLRHTYASHLVMRGATLAEVKELLGHASITMTMRYAHLSPSARKHAVALLDRGTQCHESGYQTGTSEGGRSNNGS
jgi:integrase